MRFAHAMRTTQRTTAEEDEIVVLRCRRVALAKRQRGQLELAGADEPAGRSRDVTSTPATRRAPGRSSRRGARCPITVTVRIDGRVLGSSDGTAGSQKREPDSKSNPAGMMPTTVYRVSLSWTGVPRMSGSSEPRRPQFVAEDRDRRGAESIVVGREEAAAFRSRAQQWEQVVRDERAEHCLALAVHRERLHAGYVSGDGIERLKAVARERFLIGRERHRARALAGVRPRRTRTRPSRWTPPTARSGDRRRRRAARESVPRRSH